MTSEAEARVACLTPDKKKYATLEAAKLDLSKLGHTRGRDLVAYDTCPCGWVHLAANKAVTNTVGSEPLTEDQIVLMDSDSFNQLVRADVRGQIHPETAKSLRSPRLAPAWLTALKLFQRDLGIQKEQKGGIRSRDVTVWRQRIDRVILAASERRAEAKRILSLHTHQKALNGASSQLASVLKSDAEIEDRALRMLAGEIASEQLKRNHLKEYLLLAAAQYERFGQPLSAAMKSAREQEDDAP
jgi:hypothetical protein